MSEPLKTHHNVNVLYANDIARTRQFFEEVLGFELAQVHPGGVAEYASAGGAEIALMPAKAPFRAAGAEYWFIIPDLHGYYQHLRSQGVEVTAPHVMPFGEIIEVLTPDGHKLVFHEGENK